LLLAVVGACSPETLEPEAVETCGGLVPIGERLVEDYLAVVDGLSLAVLTGDEPAPAGLVALNERGAELDRRIVRLGCDVDLLNADIAAKTADLEASTPVGEAFLDIVRGGVVGSLPDPEPVPVNGGDS
jgi:hypothetical protein